MLVNFPPPRAVHALLPWPLTGVVVGALLNHRAELAALGDAAHAPPYGAPPRAPVLQVKPRNTFTADGAAVALPAGAEALVAGATLGIVVGRTACRVAEADALSHVAGYLAALDLHLPVASHYRPGVRERARDGFLPLAAAVMAAAAVRDADALAVRVAVDGVVVHETDTAGRVRGVARLVADVSAFMTLQPGDLLLLGASHGAPRVRAGQRVDAVIDGVGRIGMRVVSEDEDEEAMR